MLRAQSWPVRHGDLPSSVSMAKVACVDLREQALGPNIPKFESENRFGKFTFL